MFCRKCGSSNDDNASRCVKCGEMLQPAGVPPGMAPQIPNYLVWAILTTICCCIPLGIPAIVYASQVNSKAAAGDIAGARDSSDKAKMWCWIAFGVGIVSNLISLVIGILSGVAQNA